MTTVDWVLAALLLLSLISGWRLGTINVIGRVGAFILGYEIARVYSSPLTEWIAGFLPSLSQRAGSETGAKLNALLSLFFEPQDATHKLLNILVFVALFIVVSWLVRWVANQLSGCFSHGLLGKINRALGALLSLTVMLVCILIFADVVAPFLGELGADKAAAVLDDSHRIMPVIRDLQYLV